MRARRFGQDPAAGPRRPPASSWRDGLPAWLATALVCDALASLSRKVMGEQGATREYPLVDVFGTTYALRGTLVGGSLFRLQTSHVAPGGSSIRDIVMVIDEYGQLRSYNPRSQVLGPGLGPAIGTVRYCLAK